MLAPNNLVVGYPSSNIMEQDNIYGQYFCKLPEILVVGYPLKTPFPPIHSLTPYVH